MKFSLCPYCIQRLSLHLKSSFKNQKQKKNDNNEKRISIKYNQQQQQQNNTVYLPKLDIGHQVKGKKGSDDDED